MEGWKYRVAGMVMSSIAISDVTVQRRTISPLVLEKVVFPRDEMLAFSDITYGNLSLPKLSQPVSLEVLSFVTYQAMQAYCGSLEVCRTADEYGLQTHLHKLMLVVASCCPLPAHELLGAVQASGYSPTV